MRACHWCACSSRRSWIPTRTRGLRQHGPRRREHGVLRRAPLAQPRSRIRPRRRHRDVPVAHRALQARPHGADQGNRSLRGDARFGRRHVEQAGLTEAIALALVDAKALPEADETFQPCSRTASSTTSRSRCRRCARCSASSSPAGSCSCETCSVRKTRRRYRPRRHVRSERHRVPASPLRRVAARGALARRGA